MNGTSECITEEDWNAMTDQGRWFLHRARVVELIRANKSLGAWMAVIDEAVDDQSELLADIRELRDGLGTGVD